MHAIPCTNAPRSAIGSGIGECSGSDVWDLEVCRFSIHASSMSGATIRLCDESSTRVVNESRVHEGRKACVGAHAMKAARPLVSGETKA